MTPDTSTLQTPVIAEDSCACIPGCSKPKTLEGHLVICGDWSQCLIVQELMACCARTYEFGDFAVRKAVKEALANAFKHGNGGAPEKCIRVDYAMDETEFRVAITDEGSGFDHTALGAVSAGPGHTPAGRGLVLMRNYMSAVRFNGLGNRVELSKRKGSGNHPDHRHE
jgi:serine/threonine-protein kinase RsbW